MAVCCHILCQYQELDRDPLPPLPSPPAHRNACHLDPGIPACSLVGKRTLYKRSNDPFYYQKRRSIPSFCWSSLQGHLSKAGAKPCHPGDGDIINHLVDNQITQCTLARSSRTLLEAEMPMFLALGSMAPPTETISSPFFISETLDTRIISS